MIDKRPSRVAGMFDAIAARYDLLNHLLSAGLDRRWRRRAIRELWLRRGETVVDVCTGTADLAIEAASRGAGRVIGIDFAGEMLRLGAAKVAKLRAVRLVRGDASNLPLRSGAADAATVAFGIRNVEQPERALAELFRVLRPGGRAAILEFSIPASRVVRAVYLPYFRHVLPRVGRLVSRHESAYTYLPASVGAFVTPAAMAAALARCGFQDVTTSSLALGVVTLYVGRRPAAR